MSKQLLINASITDFAPLFGTLDYVFKGLKQTGINGVELVIGMKSRWSIKKLRQLSEKYALPIASIHQPIWSGLDLSFDEQFVDLAKELDAKVVVFHPLSGIPFDHPHMQRYLQKLSLLQEKKGITVCLENLPTKYNIKLVNYFLPPDKSTTDILKLFSAVKQYGLKATLDIDHLRIPAPHKESWFMENLHLIGNIHLSSYTKNQEHLPLYMGDFKGKEFVEALKKHNYKGNLTFEIYYPRLTNLFSYNFEAIKKSVDFLSRGERT